MDVEERTTITAKNNTNKCSQTKLFFQATTFENKPRNHLAIASVKIKKESLWTSSVNTLARVHLEPPNAQGEIWGSDWKGLMEPNSQLLADLCWFSRFSPSPKDCSKPIGQIPSSGGFDIPVVFGVRPQTSIVYFQKRGCALSELLGKCSPAF